MRKWLALILLLPLNPATADETVSAAWYGNGPLGSAADTAIPANIMLSELLVHSSGVKFCLFAMAASYGSKAEPNTSVGADGINSILVSSV